MTELNQIYKCEVCGNVTEVLHTGEGELVCCGQPMNLMEAKTEDEGNEKHVPIIEIDGNNVKVKVGSVEHPMEDAHYIELIQLLKDGKIIASYQPSPGEKPEVVFCIENTKGLTARELCNVHGLWKSK